MLRTEIRALLILAAFDMLLDALKGKDVDPDDFEAAIIHLGFDAEEFFSLHPAIGLQKLAHEYAKLEITKDVLERMSNVRI